MDRITEATFTLTIPHSISKSSTKDFTYTSLELVFSNCAHLRTLLEVYDIDPNANTMQNMLYKVNVIRFQHGF